MTDQQPFFTDDAKKIFERNSWVNLTNSFLQENGINFKDIDENMLSSMGMPASNILNVMRVVADKLSEYYGIKKWELRNDKQISKFGVSKDHLDIMTRYIDVQRYISDFARRINGECKDVNGGMGHQEGINPAPVHANYSQNIVEVPDEVSNPYLVGMYQKTIAHIESLIKTCTDDEMLKKYEETKTKYEEKLDALQSTNKDGAK